MAETILATGSQKQVWMTKYFQEYVRLSGYRKFMSNADLNKGGIILSRYELQKEAGKTINIPFIGRLTTDDGLREFFVAFHGSRSFRDLKADTTIINSELYARPREQKSMDDNPLFQDGDLFYDGILHREVPEIDAWATATGVYNAAGASSADVRPVFLAGAGCVGVAWGQEPTPKTDYIKDYGFRPGVAIEELLGVKKINFNGVQNGLVTVHVAAGADS